MRQQSLNLTGPQAQYVLNALLSARKVKERDVRTQLASLAGEIAAIENRLSLLRDSSAGSSRGRGAAASGAPKRRHSNLSPERRAALKLQGHYLALMRQVPKTKRAGFTAMFRSKGAQAAIEALRKSLGK